MSETFDAVVVGAGPAGLSAALKAENLGLHVLLVDDQPAPGGQIWRAIERRPAATLSAEDGRGLELVRRFRASGIAYRPSTEVWQIEPGYKVFLKSAGRLEAVEARALLLACGAMERPAPFPGWTLPGVTTVGAAQIMLKSAGQISAEPVWIAGSGPLALLYAVQLLEAGGRIAGMIDTRPPTNGRRALSAIVPALRAWPDLVRGLGWIRRLRTAGFPTFSGVSGLSAHGSDRLERLSFRDGGGKVHGVPASCLLVHEGVVPRIHIPSALGCALDWREDADCLVPRLDAWGETSRPGIFLAGDGAGIAGAAAAVDGGEIAGLGLARRLGRAEAELEAERDRLARQRARHLALRPFLDRRYRPAVPAFDDGTVVCRCENVTAGDLREAVAGGAIGVNQAKAYTRCGMGPCQGRQCGYAVARVVAEATGGSMAEVGVFRVRPPYRPVTLGQLTLLDRDG